jgi:homoserine O-acetyltransferase
LPHRKKGSVGIVSTRFAELAAPPRELSLACGRSLGPVTIAYETYGKLNSDSTNAVLICHALSGSAHAAGIQEDTKEPGWWDAMIGPGKAFDTDRYFVISPNCIGGCSGSTGPSSTDPATGKPWGLSFPMLTIADMVEAQRRLLVHLGIEQLLCVAGGSMGGMQALEWAVSSPERVRSAIVISTTLKHSPQQIAFDEVGRQAIMADPDWRGGDYYAHGQPERGLAVARMVGHITYMSEKSMEEKFSRQMKNLNLSFSFAQDFEVEGYLRYKGDSFVKRFDANSYLYITKALDYFDLSGSALSRRGRNTDPRFLVIAFSSDWLYPPSQCREIVSKLKAGRADATYVEIPSEYGHDAFLVEHAEQTHLIANFLDRTVRNNGGA